VPALPGAMNKLEQDLLCDNFQARACSLPPEPNKSMFMGSEIMAANIGTIVKDGGANSRKNKLPYFGQHKTKRLTIL
jgi:hypothetical protein